VYVYL